ncbi:MAG: 2,3-bisphosphoglycerate-independent phosphoglycerate mutase [Thermoleophilia bacterium]|nr:2,3-bisphosphoglycerate-independent phosphoglycerate mutase [Thermoleophilia bacterium]
MASSNRSAQGASARPPVALVILDGWGYAEPGPGNAVSLADTPVLDGLLERCPWVLLDASGEAVGLPAGVMGNSEVGHLTLGSGRVVYQDLSRINHAIADGSFFENPVLVPTIRAAAERGAAVHLMGLLSDGGVHSAVEHIHALVRMAKRWGVDRLYLHAFMDGRDTSPTAGRGFLRDLEAFLEEEGLGRVATIVGRYYAMDRDQRWERTKLAYDTLVHGEGDRGADSDEAIRRSYDGDVTDEFVRPCIIGHDPRSRFHDGDTVVFFNFRSDRTRQLTRALIEDGFDQFDRGGPPPDVVFVGMTEYDEGFDIPVAFPRSPPADVLAEVLSRAGLTQLHIAETEKYAHVTFFFNGGRERPFPGEIRRLIPSPQDVDTYDEKPAMSAYEVTAVFEEVMASEHVDFVVLNFANPDMVGHTGDIQATVEALQHVDSCLGRVLDVLARREARVFVTADHGNAEYMLDPDGHPNTAHTTNPVRLVYVGDGLELRQGAGLSDVAPTVLCLLGLEPPAAMTGCSIC